MQLHLNPSTNKNLASHHVVINLLSKNEIAEKKKSNEREDERWRDEEMKRMKDRMIEWAGCIHFLSPKAP